jgi:uncharacterized protein YhfF
MRKTAATDDYWAAFLAANGNMDGDHTYEAAAFGDTATMADELLALVLSGGKRATASLLRDYAPGKEPLPRAGDFVVVVDGSGRPRCIWRTTEVVVKPLIDGDDAFAWDEGEGDRSRAWWLSAHQAYFSAQAQREDFAMSDSIETVFERFTIVWPPEFADPAN